MTELPVRTIDGGQVSLDATAVEGLRSQLRGTVATPDTPAYEGARALWNAMIDRRPGLIVRCAGAADVLHCVRLARDRRLLTSVRGAGHNIAGNALCDGGLAIDLSSMAFVRVDPDRRIAQVGPGATLSDFDREAQAFGLATPLGINSTTGVAGLTLGGGFGWLSRTYGMTIDNLISADLISAAGEFLRASGTENPDLFWAIRGGGGNFGVVTSFEFRLHPVGPRLLAGLVVHPLDRAGELLRRYRDVAARMPDELACWVVLRKAPPLPFLPRDVHGKEVLVFAACCAGDPAAGREALEPLLALGEPLGMHLDTMPYVAWQSAFDALLTPGARNYWKSHNFTTLDDGLLDLTVRYAAQLPTPHCEIFIGQVGGATKRVPAEATAYPHREAEYVMNVHTRWNEAADDRRCVAWARDVFREAAPYATGGVYVNFITEDETRVAAAYGGNYQRLVALKRRYDPENLFRLNQNLPTQAAA